MERRDAEHLTDNVIDILKDLKISVHNCRGKSYDNASNVDGKYSGVQAGIKNFNSLAHFVPCSTHSINLFSAYAAECCVNTISYFGFVQNLSSLWSLYPQVEAVHKFKVSEIAF